MGLLDDAIREHLELKRRHGADPEEVSRQEREALGAPVRGEFAKPEADAEPDAAAEPDEAALADEDEVGPGEPPGPDEPEDVAEEPEPGTEEDPWLVEDLADEEPLPSDRAAPAAPERQPDAVRPDEEPGEDVLEETPDFLQETPEHDRLWVEQKPPRGFDWDK